MPTTTTTTTTVTTGAQTTTTTSTATIAEEGVPPSSTSGSSLPLIEHFDTSVYEVRNYYCDSSVFDAGCTDGPRKFEGDYAAWIKRFATELTPFLDIVNMFWKIAGQAPTKICGPAHPGGFVEDEFEKAHPNCPVVVSWTVRFDSKEHGEQCWGKVFGDPTIMEHIQAHPFVKSFLRMESRFMNAAVVKPQRFFDKSKIFEVRNYTLDTALVPWTAENRQQYSNWITAAMRGEDGQGEAGAGWGIKIVSFHIAQAEPVSVTIDGATLAPVDHQVTPPHVCWTAEWDSVEQAEAFWAPLMANEQTLNGASQAGGGNPFWKVGQPMFAYAKLESNWMTAAALLN